MRKHNRIVNTAGSRIGQPRNEVPCDSPILASFPCPAGGRPATRRQDLPATRSTIQQPSNPPRAVASVYGIGGTGSTIGSVISTWAVGRTLDATHSYAPVFIGLGLLMPIALLAGTAAMGRVEPVKDIRAQ